MKKILVLFLFTILFITACDLQPDPVNGVSMDGIVIYSGNEILNNADWEIVTGRVQQLRAAGPSGHKIIWSSSDILAMEITQTGLIRVGPSPNKEAVITATSQLDSSISASVTFRTKGLR
ncbi:MAG: hypothetical protein FWD13_11905 [Treponema sp.]|nr:hypothetical protein [Treponema sp.]